MRAAAAAVAPPASKPSARDSVLLFGGETEDHEPSNEVWLSDDVGQSWRQLPAPPWPARCGASVLVLPENRRGLVLMGGWGGPEHKPLRDCWALNLPQDGGVEAGTWSELPRPKWSAREDMSAQVLSTGALLVFGGFGEGGHPLADLFVSQNAGQTWDKLRNPGISSRGFAAPAAGPGDCPMLLGGTGEGCKVLKDAWDGNVPGVNWRRLPDPPWPGRSGAAAVTLPSGKVLLLGGMGERDHVLQDVWIWEKKDGTPISTPVSPERQKEKFRLVGTTLIDRSVAEDRVVDCARSMAQEILQTDMASASLQLPEKSPLRPQLRRKIEAAFQNEASEESFVTFASDTAGMAVLVLDARRQTAAAGKTKHVIKVQGKMLYVEATNKAGFHELLLLSSTSGSLAAALEECISA